MKRFSVFLIASLIGVCFAAGQEPTYEGKSLSEWMALTKDNDPGLRCEAAQAIGNIGPEAEAAIPVLVDLLKDRFAGVSQTAMAALKKIGRPAIPALMTLLKDENKLRGTLLRLACGI